MVNSSNNDLYYIIISRVTESYLQHLCCYDFPIRSFFRAYVVKIYMLKRSQKRQSRVPAYEKSWPIPGHWARKETDGKAKNLNGEEQTLLSIIH